MKYFESHSHLDHDLFEDKPSLVENAREAGIEYSVIAPITYESNYTSMEQFPKDVYSDILFGKGLHPKCTYNEKMWDKKRIEEFEKLIDSDDRIVAIKSGIELRKKLQPHQIKRQFDFLSMFSDLAYKHKFPLILHIRDAAEETLEYLIENPLKVPAEIHCFNYDRTTMDKFIAAGIGYFGIGGKVTLDESLELQDAVRHMGLSMILLESDCPFVKVKGETNALNTSDRALPVVAKKIAEIKGLSTEEVVKATYDNACRFFDIAH